jgi:hypothetical protein
MVQVAVEHYQAQVEQAGVVAKQDMTHLVVEAQVVAVVVPGGKMMWVAMVEMLVALEGQVIPLVPTAAAPVALAAVVVEVEVVGVLVVVADLEIL